MASMKFCSPSSLLNDIALIRCWPGALAGVAQWIEHWPANQRVAGLIPRQGMCLCCGPSPQRGKCERQPYTDISISPSLLLSKNK